MSFNGMSRMNPNAGVIEPLPWRSWFAWRPVKLHGKWVWLRLIYRRVANTYVDYDNWTHYQYGNIFDVINDAK